MADETSIAVKESGWSHAHSSVCGGSQLQTNNGRFK